ncbi:MULTISPECIES: PqqD family protein [Acidianus]|uniref:Pyrroloquinoline quinone biosynthesis protein n=1 Tax=Candidatus Acidianus copahuensis TaxID=1160895 RepID=A0A031LUH1_9CREN|nr:MULTISPECIES: PqqD family protein [Acidianus]EZQ10793.1 pyrroloquinoline quinone biosynthesis protein [Candidatus Acidianus copahuensis]NON63259.1 PqqD family protein [Acidianus sp. RZ1]
MNFLDVKDRKPQKSGEFIDKAEEGDNYIIKLSEDKVYEVAPIAYYIWAMCDGEKTVNDIVEEVSKEANIEFDQLKDPIVQVLEQLQQATLITL